MHSITEHQNMLSKNWTGRIQRTDKSTIITEI